MDRCDKQSAVHHTGSKYSDSFNSVNLLINAWIKICINNVI